jgi:zinc transporter ZupT
MGVLMCISVGLHNIPIGMMVGSSFYGKKDSAFQFAMYIFGVAFSPFAGGLVVHLLKLELEGTLLACALLSSSCGMLLFIAFMELLPEIREHIRHKEIIYGLAAGAAFFICGMLLA